MGQAVSAGAGGATSSVRSEADQALQLDAGRDATLLCQGPGRPHDGEAARAARAQQPHARLCCCPRRRPCGMPDSSGKPCRPEPAEQSWSPVAPLRLSIILGTNCKTPCPGLGLFYTVLSAFLFSVASLFLKMTEDVHSVEVSAFRCVFQTTFILPGIIYYRTGFLGPRDKQVFLFFRGLLGSGAMILLYYAFQVMPLADATVITFSSPVFTSLLAWVFLKEKYSPWDLLFTLFAIAGVVLIARPPFLFGSKVSGIGGSYTDHLKGSIAALSSAICTSSTFVILRKVGISVHYFLSMWYYAVIGLIVCIIALFVMDVWTLPHCGKDRFLFILIGLFGFGGQIFLTKALQLEKAGPVAIMKTMDVVFAFIFQILFLDHLPTWWTVGGALCVVASSSGTVIRKWRQSSKEAKQAEV